MKIVGGMGIGGLLCGVGNFCMWDDFVRFYGDIEVKGLKSFWLVYFGLIYENTALPNFD